MVVSIHIFSTTEEYSLDITHDMKAILSLLRLLYAALSRSASFLSRVTRFTVVFPRWIREQIDGATVFIQSTV